DLAAYAPQWARHVEAAIGKPGLAEAIWWIHAHTKDDQWSVEQEIREAWQAEVASRTPLDAKSLVDGAVDVGWFNRICEELGVGGWKHVDVAAKYASSGGGHVRARLFADAMLGRLDRDEVIKKINESRNKDMVRAFGLMPLDEQDPDADILGRFK